MSAVKIAEQPHDLSADAARVGRILDAIRGVAELITASTHGGGAGHDVCAEAADAITMLAHEARSIAEDVERYVVRTLDDVEGKKGVTTNGR